jgi:hypothetical protein
MVLNQPLRGGVPGTGIRAVVGVSGSPAPLGLRRPLQLEPCFVTHQGAAPRLRGDHTCSFAWLTRRVVASVELGASLRLAADRAGPRDHLVGAHSRSSRRAAMRQNVNPTSSPPVAQPSRSSTHRLPVAGSVPPPLVGGGVQSGQVPTRQPPSGSPISVVEGAGAVVAGGLGALDVGAIDEVGGALEGAVVPGEVVVDDGGAVGTDDVDGVTSLVVVVGQCSGAGGAHVASDTPGANVTAAATTAAAAKKDGGITAVLDTLSPRRVGFRRPVRACRSADRCPDRWR